MRGGAPERILRGTTDGRFAMRRTALLLGVLAAAVAASPALAALRNSGPSSVLDGRWKTSVTVADLVGTGEVDAKEALQLRGPVTAEFVAGHFQVHNERTGGLGNGTFVVTGDRVRFVFVKGVDVKPGSVAVCAASVFRNRLTFKRVPGRQCLAWEASVWTRVG
jgi:hypothetical protein